MRSSIAFFHMKLFYSLRSSNVVDRFCDSASTTHSRMKSILLGCLSQVFNWLILRNWVRIRVQLYRIRNASESWKLPWTFITISLARIDWKSFSIFNWLLIRWMRMSNAAVMCLSFPVTSPVARIVPIQSKFRRTKLKRKKNENFPNTLRHVNSPKSPEHTKKTNSGLRAPKWIASKFSLAGDSCGIWPPSRCPCSIRFLLFSLRMNVCVCVLSVSYHLCNGNTLYSIRSLHRVHRTFSNGGDEGKEEPIDESLELVKLPMRKTRVEKWNKCNLFIDPNTKRTSRMLSATMACDFLCGLVRVIIARTT